MSTVTLDIIEGSNARQQRDASGTPVLEFYRVALVKGLTGTKSARMKEALDALDADGEQMGSEHPTIANLFLEERQPEVLSITDVRVRLVYREKPAEADQTLVIEGDTSVSQQTVNTGWTVATILEDEPSPLYVTYTPTGGSAITQGGTLTAMLPESTRRFSRTEFENPDAKARAYVGKINGTEWEAFPDTDLYEWLCTRIAWTSRDGGASYQVTYEFQWKEDGWFQYLVYIDPATGRPPGDPVPSPVNGMTLCCLNRLADFNGLQLEPTEA